MKDCYIIESTCISAQNTFESKGFLDNITSPEGMKWKALYPDYKKFFSAVASRRMGSGVKMGLAAAFRILQKANLETPDAIVAGTGMGCIEDTEKFLGAIIENNEEFLTPTSFIQSTHNTVGAQIALSLKCRGYNNTYVQASNSFESALIDAQLLLIEEEAYSVLVGGVDELGKEFIDYVAMMELKSQTHINVPFSEGATFFLLSNSPNPHAIRLIDVEIFHSLRVEEIAEEMSAFLIKNNLSNTEIDLLILGNNGDEFDVYYERINASNKSIPSITYKQFCGEYFTASGFGLWTAFQTLINQTLPDYFSKEISIKMPIKRILLYNQFKGKGHSFILLSKE